MQKTAEVFLVLSPEERTAAEEFVQKRLQTISSAHASGLEALNKSTTSHLRRLIMQKERYRRHPSRASQVMVKLYDAAITGMMNLAAGTRGAGAAVQAAGPGSSEAGSQAGDGSEATGAQGADAVPEELLVQATEEEESGATKHIQSRMEELGLQDLRAFRDACQGLLTWWDSERGQMEGLRLQQYGDVNSSKGRVIIRQKREAIRQDVLTPFKKFFQELNIHFQKTSREVDRQTPEDEA